MVESDDSIPKKWGLTLKVLSLLSAVVLVLLAVLNFLTFTISDPIDVIMPIYYIFFGVLIISAECSIKFIIKKFLFVQGYIGRGIFYIFVGTLCIRGDSVFQYVAAAFLIFIGIIYLSCYCGYKGSEPAKTDNPYLAAADAPAGAQV